MKKIIFTLILTAAFMLFWPNVESQAKEKEGSIESVTNDLGNLLKEADSDEIKKLLDFAKQQIEKGNWETEQGIDNAIKEGEKEFGVTLTKEEKEKIKEIIKKVKSLKLAPEFILEQAEKIYEKYGEELTKDAARTGNKIIEETKEKIQEEVKKSIKDYFSDMVGKVKGFFWGFFEN